MARARNPRTLIEEKIVAWAVKRIDEIFEKVPEHLRNRIVDELFEPKPVNWKEGSDMWLEENKFTSDVIPDWLKKL